MEKCMTDSLWQIQLAIGAGSEQALASLYSLYNRRLHHFARAITRSPEIAEEIVEDVFVKLWSNRHTIHDISNLTVYLYVAVKNRSLNAVAQRAKELLQAPFDDLAIETGPLAADPYSLLVTAEMMQKMQAAVEALPPRCKMIFKLVREDGLRHKEVADILNIAVNTVDVQMAIAIKKICTALQVDRVNKHWSDKVSSRE